MEFSIATLSKHVNDSCLLQHHSKDKIRIVVAVQAIRYDTITLMEIENHTSLLNFTGAILDAANVLRD